MGWSKKREKSETSVSTIQVTEMQDLLHMQKIIIAQKQENKSEVTRFLVADLEGVPPPVTKMLYDPPTGLTQLKWINSLTTS